MESPTPKAPHDDCAEDPSTNPGNLPQEIPVNLEGDPLQRREYLSVMVHFYRGEMARSTAWRQRLDATTHWAVLTCAGMLSFAFAAPSHGHYLLPFSNLVVFMLMVIEARRYRYFGVYRARVRMLEENFILPIVTRQLDSPKMRWREEVAADLDHPQFKCTFFQALGFRLRRNYMFIFVILQAAWFIKLAVHPTIAATLPDIVVRARVGIFPPHLVVGIGVAFFTFLVLLLIVGWKLHGDYPTDEVAGVVPELDRWKI